MNQQEYATVKEAFDQTLARVGATTLEVPWEDPMVYGAWLTQQYHLVRHTTRFLALAAARSGVENRDLHYQFIHHLKEESHHDLPILKDMKALNLDIEMYAQLPETRLIRNNQYYWLEYGSPIALTGYALLLEGLSVTVVPKMIERIKKAGYDKSVTFLNLHATVDQDHYADGLEGLKNVSLKEAQDILHNLEESSMAYERMLVRLPEQARAQKALNTNKPVRAAQVA